MPNATQASQNIMRSVQEAIDGAGFGAPLLYDEAYTSDPGFDAWIDVRWGKRNVEHLPGGEKRVTWVLFFDLWYRLKSDKLGGKLAGLADKVLAFIRDRYVTIFDFTDPAAPVDTGFKARISQQPGGDDPLDTTDIVRGRSIAAEVVYFERA